MTPEENTKVNLNIQKAPKPPLPKVEVNPPQPTPPNPPEKISDTLLILWNQLLKKIPLDKLPKVNLKELNPKQKLKQFLIKILEDWLAKLKQN